MLSTLPPRERQIVDVLYERGRSTVAEIGEALAVNDTGSLTGSAIRAMLKRLEDKGFVVREHTENGFAYAPAVSERTARKSALSQVVKVFFNGSAVGAATALLGMEGKIADDELDELEKLIARARSDKPSERKA
ncbi:MAG TPA: BlaI/MecI/CopY family transcriptional regulator [Novosphingobium sp.]|nr:BlaI/MecI/CopY family transcriptional regulator [Novosphingobium sp.]